MLAWWDWDSLEVLSSPLEAYPSGTWPKLLFPNGENYIRARIVMGTSLQGPVLK